MLSLDEHEKSFTSRSDPEIIKLFMLNSTEHEILTARKNLNAKK